MPIVVLGVTGCIGAYKACEVLRELQRRDVDVHVVMTAAATRFVTPDDVRGALAAPGVPRPVGARARTATSGTSAWPTTPICCWWPRPPPTPSASSRGASPTTPSARSTSRPGRPVVVAPGHERQHVRAPGGAGEPRRPCARAGWASSSRARATWPAAGSGKGRLAEIERDRGGRDGARSPAGATSRARRVLVTAGPTVEDIDPVRFVSNRSSREDGLPPGGGGARPRGAGRAGLGPHEPRRARRGRARGRALGRGDARGRSTRTSAGPRSSIAAAAVADYRPGAGRARRSSRRATAR